VKFSLFFVPVPQCAQQVVVSVVPHRLVLVFAAFAAVAVAGRVVAAVGRVVDAAVVVRVEAAK